MEKRIYKLINWWLSRNGNAYILHGNNTKESSVPGYFIHELVDILQIIRASVKEDGFIFETQEEGYLCEMTSALDERFDWLEDASLWDTALTEADIAYYKKLMVEEQEKRRKKEARALTIEWINGVDDHIVWVMNNEKESLLESATYEANNGCDHPMSVTMNNDVVKVSLETEERYIEREYQIVAINTIEIINPYSIPIVIANISTIPITVITPFGQFLIPTGSYKIAPDIIRGRISIY